MYTTPAGQTVRRHPIRGFFWGVLMGLGIAALLIITNTIAIGTLSPILVVVFSAMFGIVWGLFAPPRRAKGEPRPGIEPLPAEPVDDATPPGAGPGEVSAEAVRATEAMSAEQTAASRETVVSAGGMTEPSGTLVDSTAVGETAETADDVAGEAPAADEASGSDMAEASEPDEAERPDRPEPTDG